ncbi:MAG: AAA family ATPase [Firmicutes bacterium]|nr:AAA family ATPase [Bacillota bacterium]
MNSNNIEEEVRLYVSNALWLYSIIRNRKIESTELNNKEYHNNDKIALSFFLAAFVTDINLLDIISEYNVDVEDLLLSVGITEEMLENPSDENIVSKCNEEFEKFMEDYAHAICEKYLLEEVSAEVLFSLLIESKYNGIIYDLILKKIPQIYSSKDGKIELFETVKKYSLDNKHMIIKNSNEKSPIQSMFEYFFGLDPSADIEYEIIPSGNMIPKNIENDNQEREEEIDSNDLEVFNKLENIIKKFIGQEEVCEYLFYNIINNQQLATRDDVFDGERSIIFLDGPTGTGKTAITREITKVLDIPFAATSVTNYSSSGYVGGNLTDILEKLLDKADGDLEKAERGIVVLDEFDKLSYKRDSGGLSMKKAVQQQLLDFMGGGSYDLVVGNGPFSQLVSFDTSKLTFVCLAALTDLREEKVGKKQPIGYCSTQKRSEKTYNITPQDLVDIGLERELVGRLNTYLHTEEYSKDILLRILHESEISPLVGLKKWVESKNKELIIDDEVYYLIVDAAYDLNTGARALQTVVNGIRTVYLKEVLTGNDKEVYLDSDRVSKIINNNSMRRVRK